MISSISSCISIHSFDLSSAEKSSGIKKINGLTHDYSRFLIKEMFTYGSSLLDNPAEKAVFSNVKKSQIGQVKSKSYSIEPEANVLEKTKKKNSVNRHSLKNYKKNKSTSTAEKVKRVCIECKTTKTPLWRLEGTTCNACALKKNYDMKKASLNSQQSSVAEIDSTKKSDKKNLSNELLPSNISKTTQHFSRCLRRGQNPSLTPAKIWNQTF